MSSSFFVRPDRKAEYRAGQESHYVEILFMIASNSIHGLAARDGFKAPELTLVYRAQWAANRWLRQMRRRLTKI